MTPDDHLMFVTHALNNYAESASPHLLDLLFLFFPGEINLMLASVVQSEMSLDAVLGGGGGGGGGGGATHSHNSLYTNLHAHTLRTTQTNTEQTSPPLRHPLHHHPLPHSLTDLSSSHTSSTSLPHSLTDLSSSHTSSTSLPHSLTDLSSSHTSSTSLSSPSLSDKGSLSSDTLLASSEGSGRVRPLRNARPCCCFLD